MKKNNITTWLLLTVPGICAGLLRGWELAYHYDRTTGLFDRFAGSFILPVFTALTLVMYGLYACTVKGQLRPYCEEFKIHTKDGLLVGVVSSIGLCAVGVVKLLSGGRLSDLIFGLVTVLTGMILLTLIRARWQGKTSERVRLLSSMTIFWACFLLLLTYLEHPSEPVIRVFCYDILAACFLTIALFYEISALFYQKSRRMGLFFSLGGVFLIWETVLGRLAAFLMSGDTESLTEAPLRMLLYLCIGLRLGQNVFALLRKESSTGNTK